MILSLRLIEDSFELFQLLLGQCDGESVEQFLLVCFVLRVVTHENNGSIGDLADILSRFALSLESGGSERNVRSVEKIENMNFVAYIYLYLRFEFFMFHLSIYCVGTDHDEVHLGRRCNILFQLDFELDLIRCSHREPLG